MTIIHAYLNGENYTLTGTGYEPKGEILDIDSERLRKDNLQDLKIFMLEGYLSSTGKINPPDKYHPTWYPLGDPTEGAFSTLVLKAGFTLEEIVEGYKRLNFSPSILFGKGFLLFGSIKASTSFLLKALSNPCWKSPIR